MQNPTYGCDSPQPMFQYFCFGSFSSKCTVPSYSYPMPGNGTRMR